MPSLNQSIRALNMKMFEPMQPEPGATSQPSTPAAPVNPGVFTICPLPLVVAYPDQLRQFYREGIPQSRVLPPS